MQFKNFSIRILNGNGKVGHVVWLQGVVSGTQSAGFQKGEYVFLTEQK